MTSDRTTPTSFDARWHGRSIPHKHWHFHRQLLKRYGIVLEPGEFSLMLKDIASGRAIAVERLTETKVIYSVRNQRLFERYYVLVERGYVITALPPTKRLNALRRELPGATPFDPTT